MPCSENHFMPVLEEIRARPDPDDPETARKLKHPNWGGRRPGAGAPKGNLNALKHGRYSQRQVQLLEALVEIPEARDALIALTKRNRRLRKQAQEGAGVLMTRLLERVAEIVLNQACPEHGRRENDQDQDNQEFLDFLNTATAQIRILLEKQSRLRRAPIKRPRLTHGH